MNMIKTKPLKIKEVTRKWYLLDGRDRVLGRLAVEISKLLMGKNEVRYVNYLDLGHCVVVTNIGKIKITGAKEKDKTYYRYSGYPGGLKKETYEKLFLRRPTEVLRKAVLGMLPDNKFRAPRLARLHLYVSDKIPQKVVFANVEGK